ncbi:MAG: hypothetical protein K2K21_17590 [Lachnospiraceae bacterium]|nr:hypothetical protein [Lachnospiraceae bacterium]
MEYSEDLVKKAYKKLKCSVYFDKTLLLLRQQIVEFEDRKIDEKLSKICDALINGGEKWDTLQKNILKSISYRAFPKSLVTSKSKDSQNGFGERQEGVLLVTNHVPEEIEIDRLQYFISMDVEGHILGVLWLLTIGWRLDRSSYEKSYGNRLRKLVIQELKEENNISYSPYLFEPYFQQYESWRDSALEFAQNSINKDQDVVVFTMDFESFFYNVDLSEEAFKKILEEVDKSKALDEKTVDVDNKNTIGEGTQSGDTKNKSVIFEERLNSFVKEVIFKFSGLFSDKYQGRKFLPIGFLPSNVLANWCLKYFDKAVSNGWNPLYFGRYVDDVIIVDKVEKNSDLYEMMNNEEPDADSVLEYCLVQCSRWNGFVPDNKCEKYALFKKDGNRYTLNPIYNLTEDSKSNIGLQNAKVKMFYFRHGESSALLQCFRNQIIHNKSEFRFLPEDEAVFDADDYSEIYNIDNKESINKFRGVDGISIDKFSLSKLLGKYMRISSLINDKVENKFAQDIAKIYTRTVIIDNYITWEKVIEIFVVNGQWKSLGVFIQNIFSALERTKCINDSENDTENVRQNLQDYLYSAWVRALSLVWGTDVAKHVKVYEKKFGKSTEDILKDRRCYLLTRMYDKYIVPVLLDVLGTDWMKNADDINEICLYDFTTILKESCKRKSSENENCKDDINYVYFPYMVTMYDLYIKELVVSDLQRVEMTNMIREEAGAFCNIDDIKEQYISVNFNIKNVSIDNAVRVVEANIKGKKIPVISVGTTRQGNIKIAIANIALKASNFEQLVKGRPNRSYERYKSLAHIVNSAIAEKADMLVLPEACVPIEWLPAMIRTCTKNNIALITGIEHIIYEERIYNYTAVTLPYEEQGYKCAVLSLHLKNHYAPHEVELIHGYRLNEISGKSYELYHWKDCWFPVYCCFELASIEDRALFSAYADVLVAVEWNKDTNYYSNILEALSRDLHCYCVQVNSSDYGDSRITMPSKTDMKDIIKTKGGNNATVLVGTIDYEKLRNFQFKEYNLQKMNKEFKPTPPLFNKEVVGEKIRGNLEDFLKNP